MLDYPIEDTVFPLCQSRVSGLTDKSENGGIAFLDDVKVMNRCMDPVRSYSRGAFYVECAQTGVSA